MTAQPADGQDLANFDSNSFAAVACAFGLMHMSDPQQAVQEAFRVLQPGGIYLATIWKRDNAQMAQVKLLLASILLYATQLHVVTRGTDVAEPNHELNAHVQHAAMRMPGLSQLLLFDMHC